MQFTKFYCFAGRIAYAEIIHTETLESALLEKASQALRQLHEGAEQVSEGLPCTVRLGDPVPTDIFERLVRDHPEHLHLEGRDANQVKAEYEERSRKQAFVLSRGEVRHKYRLLYGRDDSEKSGLHGALAGMSANQRYREEKRVLTTHEKEDLASVEEVIWNSCPAVLCGNLNFTDLAVSVELIAFSTYFAAAMFLSENS